MLEKIRGLTSTTLRTVDDLLHTFDHRPIRVARWFLQHAADVVDVPRRPQPVVSVAAPAVGASPAPTAPVNSAPATIDSATLRDELLGAEPPLVVDIREPVEIQGGIIPGARLIPMREVLSAIGELRQPGRRVVVYCAHGVRSANIVAHLRDRGVDARTLGGGLAAWQGAGGELVRP
jgi:adenylyltransferase/sulfurtransferase